MTDNKYYVLYCNNNKRYIGKYAFSPSVQLLIYPNMIFSSKLAADIAYAYFENITNESQNPSEILMDIVIKEIKLVDESVTPDCLDNLKKFTFEMYQRYGSDLLANFPEDISKIINKNLQFSYIIFNDASDDAFNSEAQLVNMNMYALATNDRNTAINYKLILNNPMVINPKTLEII